MQDIEQLQQKVEDYKKTLAALDPDHLKKKMLDMEQLLASFQEQQATEKQKLEQEISNLSLNLNALKQNLSELTRKVSSIMQSSKPNEPYPEEKKATVGPKKTATKNQAPSFNQLQKLFDESYEIENPSSGHPKRLENIMPKTKSPNHLPNFNQPSSKKVISVKLNTVSNTPPSNLAPPQDEPKPVQPETPVIDKPPVIPEVPIEHEPFEKNTLAEQTENPPPKNKESSLLRFFRKQ